MGKDPDSALKVLMQSFLHHNPQPSSFFAVVAIFNHLAALFRKTRVDVLACFPQFVNNALIWTLLICQRGVVACPCLDHQDTSPPVGAVSSNPRPAAQPAQPAPCRITNTHLLPHHSIVLRAQSFIIPAHNLSSTTSPNPAAVQSAACTSVPEQRP